MGNSPLTRDKFRHPEIFLSELIRKSSQGLLSERSESPKFLMRAIVIAVDPEGGKLENESGDGVISHKITGKSYDVKARRGPRNPRNSVKARLISNAYDMLTHDDDLRVFWPFFPEHDCSPVKPGEHVYVVFEDERKEHGLWLSRVSGHEGLNVSVGQDHFVPVVSRLSQKFDDSRSISQDQEFNRDEHAGDSKPDNRLSSLAWD